MKTLVSAAVFAALTTTAIAEPITIFISGNRSETPGLGIPAATTVIGAKEIAESGATTLVDVLKTQSDIQISDYSSHGQNAVIDMRGFGETANSNVAILVNNRKLNPSGDTTAFNFNTINLEQIERIEIIKGSAGVLYGNQAVGGLINIITKKPIKDSSSITQTIGSYDHLSTNLNITKKINPTADFTINAYKSESKGYRDHNSSEVERLDLSSNFTTNLGDTHVSFQNLNDYQTTPGALLLDSSSYPDINDVGRTGINNSFVSDYIKNEINTTTINHKTNLNVNTVSDLNFRHISGYREFIQSFQGYTERVIAKQNRELFELSPHFTTKFGDSRLSYGFDLQNTDYQLVSSQGTQKVDQDISAFYGQLQSKINDEIAITTGIRHAIVENFIPEAHLYRNDYSVLSTENYNLNDDITVGSLGIEYSPKSSDVFFARADQNYRFAKVEEHTNTTDYSGTIEPIGLKNQTGISYEIGYKFVSTTLNFDFSLSRLKLENEITSAIRNLGYTHIYNLNLDSTTKDSFNLSFNNHLSNNFLIGSGYTYTKAKITSGDHKGNTTPGVAEHSASGFVIYKPNDKWTHKISTIYTGNSYLISDFENDRQKLGGHTVVNTSSSYKNADLTLQFSIYNFFDELYYSYGATSDSGDGVHPAPERNFMLTAKYTFE